MQLNCFEDLVTQLQRENKISWELKNRLIDCAKEALNQGGSIRVSLSASGDISTDIVYLGETK